MFFKLLSLTHGPTRNVYLIASVLFLSTTVWMTSPVVAQATDDGLVDRVEQLEQQIVDLQVALGTLESLAKGRASGGASLQSSSGGSADISQLEIQVRAMSGQLAALARDVRTLQNSTFSNTGSVTNNSYAAPTPIAPTAEAEQPIEGFGSVTVTQEQAQSSAIKRDPIGSILANKPEQQVASVASVPPRQAYDKAYGYLLEQDYGAAEAAFADFVVQHPKDKLAGNAQYWLGESHYVRGNYRAAANAFLKGYKGYRSSPKAPDSLLKLAMSLSRLGQKPSACATFQELKRRFPRAPQHIVRRSDAERQRAGC